MNEASRLAVDKIDIMDDDERASSADVGRDDSGYSSDKEDSPGINQESDESTPTESSSGDNDDSIGDVTDKERPTAPEERITAAVEAANLMYLESPSSPSNNTEDDGTGGTVNSGGSSNRSFLYRVRTESPALTDEETSESSDDNRWHFFYLKKKRHLLKRAGDFVRREEVYNACTAKAAANAPLNDPPLWIEAREILEELSSPGWSGGPKEKNAASSKNNTEVGRNLCSSSSSAHSGSSPPPRECLHPPPVQNPIPLKKSRIDTSSVNHCFSHVIGNDEINPMNGCSDQADLCWPLTFHSDTNWMARALGILWNNTSYAGSQQTVSTAAASSLTSNNIWRALLNSERMIPVNPMISSKNSVSLEDAIAQTSVAQ